MGTFFLSPSKLCGRLGAVESGLLVLAPFRIGGWPSQRTEVAQDPCPFLQSVVVQAGSWLWRVCSLWSLVGRSPEPERPRSEQGREQTLGDRGRWVPVSRRGSFITGHGRVWAWSLAHPGAVGPSQESFSG